ncbi:MAG: 30S ribosomal protein S1, partial [Thermoanaerobaculia bacterium]
AFVDLGGKSDGVVSLAELTDEEGELTAAVDDTVEGIVTGRDEASGGLILRVRPDAAAGGGAGTELALDELARAHEHGTPVEGSVTEAIKGGVEVQVLGVRAFCPVSQIEIGYVEEPEVYVGRRLSFRVTKFQRSGRGRRPDVVLSRRALLEEEAAERRRETLARLEEGAVVRGTVTSVTGYGAFVDLGGLEGLLHVSEMSHDRVEDPAEVVSPGDSVEVKILKMDEEPGKGLRISLSRRALEQDPWEEAAARFPEGSTVPGRVMRLEPYGAFVRLAPGLEGMAHVSELDPGRRVNHPREVVELGQDVTVRVLSVDTERRRIALSMATDGEPTGAEARREAAATGSHVASSGFGSLAEALEKARKKE